MSNIHKAFENGKAFIVFLTAGDPNLEKTETYILEMVKAGADLIEIGIPFSDPIAEGKVIEAANMRALKAGVTLPKIFDMVTSVRKIIQTPLVFLTYLNPIFSFGYEKFFTKCNEVGINGIIIPDLPFEEQMEVLPYAKANYVDVITLITPTSDDRIAHISKDATGFIYLVSSMGVTGVRDEIKTDLQSIINSIRLHSKTPIAVGFGVSTPEQVKNISNLSDGVIVGSAIVKIIEQYGENAKEPLFDYVSEMKKVLKMS